MKWIVKDFIDAFENMNPAKAGAYTIYVRHMTVYSSDAWLADYVRDIGARLLPARQGFP